ncbi:MAG: QueT transporter family protein [Oscillospiraceae bacterium]
MDTSIRKISFAAVVAAVYAALTILLAPISYGPVQMRLSEAMCILPFFFPMSVWGLFIGCIIANLMSAYGIIDVVFGSAATLMAALCTMYMGKKSSGGVLSKALACLPPVVFNAVIIGAVISFSATPDAFWAGFIVNGAEVALGEFAVMYVIGLPLMIYLPGTAFFQELSKHKQK